MSVQKFNDAAGNLERVVLSGPKESSVEIYMYGATVTSWKSQGHERLFVSKQAKLDGTKAIRGGIPLVFPQFGPGALPQHGFARTRPWTFVEASEHGEGIAATFELTDNEETRASAWPFRFILSYTVDITATTLSTIIKYENTDTKEFDFTSLMHTYFRVPDIAHTTVTGLESTTYIDKIKSVTAQESRTEIAVDANEDRVYEDVPGIVGVRCGGETVSIRRFNFKDIVLWNPWAEKAREMSDFGDDEYTQMICVEAGTVASKISLRPGQTISCGQLLALEKDTN
ncbi:hypothetical protein GGF40_000575 [Coemansia sp. RSA 1286]|nr:hypothetical protein GGF39_000646 [Coemansia sp. RSA 1721]KAJ2639749.1 hypothetical protein GGF40_000575 [Coemansia sp. RSA 1286]